MMKLLGNSLKKSRKSLNFLLLISFTLALVALLLPAAVLPDFDTRSIFHLWESGHLFVSFLGCRFLFIFYPQAFLLTTSRRLTIFIGTALLGAVGLEGLQSFISTKAVEATDIVGDMAGVLLFLSFCGNVKKNIYLYGTTLILVGFVFWAILSSFADEMLARYQFPLLADFETPFEASRFAGKTGRAHISDEQAFQGRHSLKLSFFPGPWSGMMLRHFPSHWHGFTQLHFAIYNPNPHPVSFHFRIHDAMHEQGNKDIYYRNISLPKGVWTSVEIPLDEVEIAPQGRHMNLDHISGLGFFVEEETPLNLYLDSIRLE